MQRLLSSSRREPGLSRDRQATIGKRPALARVRLFGAWRFEGSTGWGHGFRRRRGGRLPAVAQADGSRARPRTGAPPQDSQSGDRLSLTRAVKRPCGERLRRASLVCAGSGRRRACLTTEMRGGGAPRHSIQFSALTSLRRTGGRAGRAGAAGSAAASASGGRCNGGCCNGGRCNCGCSSGRARHATDKG